MKIGIDECKVVNTTSKPNLDVFPVKDNFSLEVKRLALNLFTRRLISLPEITWSYP